MPGLELRFGRELEVEKEDGIAGVSERWLPPSFGVRSESDTFGSSVNGGGFSSGIESSADACITEIIGSLDAALGECESSGRRLDCSYLKSRAVGVLISPFDVESAFRGEDAADKVEDDALPSDG